MPLLLFPKFPSRKESIKRILSKRINRLEINLKRRNDETEFQIPN